VVVFGVFTRIATGRARVVREVRAATPLMATLRAPVTARGPWLTAALNTAAARRFGGRPVAVVVEPHPQGRPEALALLVLRRRGPRTVVSLLGADVAPLPGGRPPARLLARDESAAALLADGILGLLGRLRGPWALRLAGLPLGDPTVRDLAGRLPTAVLGNARSAALVDELDRLGPVDRTRDPARIDRALPDLLDRQPDRRAGEFLRTAARVHAAAGQLELAAVPGDDGPRAGLLTLLDGADRWPWWGYGAAGGLRTQMGSPLVSLTVPARWPRLSRPHGGR
jgi:hypothetical protein